MKLWSGVCLLTAKSRLGCTPKKCDQGASGLFISGRSAGKFLRLRRMRLAYPERLERAGNPLLPPVPASGCTSSVSHSLGEPCDRSNGQSLALRRIFSRPISFPVPSSHNRASWTDATARDDGNRLLLAGARFSGIVSALQ